MSTRSSAIHEGVHLGVASRTEGSRAALNQRLGQTLGWCPGIGPLSGYVAGVAPGAAGLSVTLTVRNDGERTGATTCRIYDPAVGGITPDDAYVQSPRIEGGTSATFSELVTSLGTEVRPLAVACR